MLIRRTEWFKVRTERGVEGWASARDLTLTTLADGTPLLVNLGDRAGFPSHRWESGVFGGAYAGATLVSAYQALSMTDNLKVEVGFAVSGQPLQWLSTRHRTGARVHAGVARLTVRHPGQAARARGAQGDPGPPLIANNQTAYVGVGRALLPWPTILPARRIREVTRSSRTNTNEVKKEWKVGFAFFY